MVDDIPETILEPTPGKGNLVRVLKSYFPDSKIDAPKDFYDLYMDRKFNNTDKYDLVFANPPFTPMIKGYEMLEQFTDMSDFIIVIMPWLVLINSEKRTKWLIEKGLCEVRHLPRSAFNGSRVQTCILKIVKGYNGEIKLSFANKED